MAGLNTLPAEVLHNIIERFPRPLKTSLLLINKNLCSLFMIDQFRDLSLDIAQAIRMIKVITNNDIKKPCSVLQYCNLLDKIYNISLYKNENKKSEKEILRFISQCENLRVLMLSTPFSLPWDFSSFESLPSNIIQAHFFSLHIGNGDKTIQSLIKYLKRSVKLAILCISSKSVIKELKRLKYNSTMTDLELCDNNIGAEGACALAESLKQNTTLVKLDIYCNNIGSDGARALAEGLRQNATLKNLNLLSNSIGSDGAYALAESLKLNKTLTDLGLEENNIDTDGIRAVAGSLKQNTTLTNLHLSYNNINSDGHRALTEGLKENTTLKKLYIREHSSDMLMENTTESMKNATVTIYSGP